MVATSTANADLCLQNPSASRNIRLTGSTIFLGDVASPSMSVGDTAVAILKDTTVNNLHASGAIGSNALSSAGVHLGSETTPGFARAVLTCSGTSSRSLLDFSYAGNSGGAYARIEGVPLKSGTPELKIHTDGVVRCTFTSTSMDLTTDMSAPNIMPRTELASTYQPLLSSTYDIPSSGFHSIIGSASALGKQSIFLVEAGVMSNRVLKVWGSIWHLSKIS